MRRVLLLVAVVVLVAGATSERFDEALSVDVLPEQRVAAHWAFSTTIARPARTTARESGGDRAPSSTALFPRSLWELASTLGVRELRVAFTQGRWQMSRWGVPAGLSALAPGGIELYALFDDADATGAPRNASALRAVWHALTTQLSGGSLGASVQLLSRGSEWQPRIDVVLPAELLAQLDASSSSFLSSSSSSSASSTSSSASSTSPAFYAALPHEVSCTENLTPWLRLLPCRSAAGLGALAANPCRLFDSRYTGLSLHLVRTRSEQGQERVTVRQRLSVVLDAPLEVVGVLRDARTPGDALPALRRLLLASARDDSDGNDDDNDALPPCTVASSSTLSLPFERLGQAVAAPASVSRSVLRSALSHGTLVVAIANPGDSPVRLSYVDILPWPILLYMSSLRFEHASPRGLLSTHFSPAEPHGAPTTLRLEFLLQPHETVRFSIDFECAFLHWTKFPPDPQRGLDLPASWIAVHSSRGAPARIYTQPLQIVLPTPDFSMPYNVLTLSGTAIALFVSSIIKASTRRYHPLLEGADLPSERLLIRFVRFIISKLGQLVSLVRQ